MENNKGTTNNRYQYSYVPLAEVINNPDEFIIPGCQPACRAFWDKNIETYMVSNNDDSDFYVLVCNLSSENEAIFKQKMTEDSRYFWDSYRQTYGIEVKGMSDEAVEELVSLTSVFKIQDTVRYASVEKFLESYKCTDGEYGFDSDSGMIFRKPNPKLADATLEEALEKEGKKSLYVESEGRVYAEPIYLRWHQRYLNSLKVQLDSATLTDDETDFSGEHGKMKRS